MSSEDEVFPQTPPEERIEQAWKSGEKLRTQKSKEEVLDYHQMKQCVGCGKYISRRKHYCPYCHALQPSTSTELPGRLGL
jgi:uncharacterized OB-fold protein